jgi:hypothetical protein
LGDNSWSRRNGSIGLPDKPDTLVMALPYGILRRMSTDDHGTGPSGCGAVIVGGLIGQTDDHVVLHHGYRAPSLATATVHA